MERIKIPKVKQPRRGLHDIFINQMAQAMQVSKREARAILKQGTYGND